VNLNRIDSIRFYVTEKMVDADALNNSMVAQIQRPQQRADCKHRPTKLPPRCILICPTTNRVKSEYQNFPRLDASAGGVIYFDRKEVLNGAYDRSVFFVVPPFKLDSLNDADPASINF